MSNYIFKDDCMCKEDLGSLIGLVIIDDRNKTYLEKFLFEVKIISEGNREIIVKIFDKNFICSLTFNSNDLKKYIILTKKE